MHWRESAFKVVRVSERANFNVVGTVLVMEKGVTFISKIAQIKQGRNDVNQLRAAGNGAAALQVADTTPGIDSRGLCVTSNVVL